MSTTETTTMDTTTTPAGQHRTRTLGRTLLATGPSDQTPGLHGGRYGDGSRWLEIHLCGRYIGLYR